MRKLLIGLLILAAVIIVPFVLLEEQASAWSDAALGIGGNGAIIAILVAGLLALDVILPVPSSVVSATAGVFLGPLAGTAASATGMTLGCWLGYALGASYLRAGVRRWVADGDLARAEQLFERFGVRTLLVCRAVPVLAEASVIAAGVARMDLVRFGAATLLPNIVISAAYAAGGDAVRQGRPAVLVGVLVAMALMTALIARVARPPR
jgi:uncharacterized membrane protein YdjX (TVP38/TMEM64 family)